MKISPIQYTWSGDFAIAYQVVGEGPIDLVYLPPWASNLDGNWQWSHHARFLRRLASFSRLILHDPRGWGCSDRYAPGQAPSLQDHVDDLFAVIAATNASRPAVFANADSGEIAMLAAATRPESLSSLVLFNTSACEFATDDEPWWSEENRNEEVLDSIRRATNWDDWSRMFVRDGLPSHADDEQAIAWFATLQRLTEGPGAVLTHLAAHHHRDVRSRLADITAPTLILSRGSAEWKVKGSAYMAERIPNTTLSRLPGEDVYAWAGDWGPVVDEIQRFITGTVELPEPDVTLATVLFTDLVDSTVQAAALGDRGWTEVRERHDRTIRNLLRQHRGREVKTMGDGFLATFDIPARGVRCAIDIVREITDMGLEIRAGLHTGEVETDEDGDVSGLAVAIGARVGARAGAAEVLVSQTIKDLTAGSGLAFEDAGEHELKGVPDRWRLYRVLS